ncbi:hypothetical protein OKW21_005307 [Catalinimonas alkaloidigena]|uniref:hypothetical protein n=1 Tax=Catalinimonas alkaloidigena TaxID=1075417 RepID=UPI00240637F6|nr:hypothetical protein [Catalinimonas alkaloidigena]MDF9800044.1 hypothetical protein [Catalinimonas alkaloidigena]
MKSFKFIPSLALFIFLACSCSNIFYADFEEDVVVSLNNASPLVRNKQGQQWSNILHPADGFNIITKGTLIAQRYTLDNADKANETASAQEISWHFLLMRVTK